MWLQHQKVSASDGAAFDIFGSAVALDDNTAVVGAPFATVGGNAAQGAAYVFTASCGTWSEQQKLTAAEGTAYDYFGSAVALDGIGVFSGAPGGDVNTRPGVAYVFAATCPPSYNERDSTLDARGLYVSGPYDAPGSIGNGILGAPGGFRLYALYSNATTRERYRIPGSETHRYGPVGTYRWGVKAGDAGGAYVLCTLHP